MKKQIIILLLAGIPAFGLAQYSRATKTNGPCTAEMAQNHKGRWVNSGDLLFDNKLGSQSEMIKRLDEIHKMLVALYPQPVGYDLAWNQVIRNSTFGGKVKTDKTRDGVMEIIKEKPALLNAEDKDPSQFSLEYDRWGNLIGLNFQLNKEGTGLADPDSEESDIDSRWSWNAIASPQKGFFNKLLIK